MTTEQLNGHKPATDDGPVLDVPEVATDDVAQDETEAAPDAAEAMPDVIAVDTPGLRRAIVPEAWQRHNIRGTLIFHRDLNYHRAKYHGFRLPLYLYRVVFYTLRGIVRLGARLQEWHEWPEGWLLESQAVARGVAGHHDAMAAHKQRRQTRGTRGRIIGVCAVVALAVFVALVLYLPPLGWLIVWAVAVPLLVREGKPYGKPLVKGAVVPARLEAPNQEIILRALASLGLSPLARAVADGGVTFTTPIHRDGPGWAVQIELPHGVTAVEVIGKREKLAAALRRPLSAVWPLPIGAEHPGMLSLWVGFTALNKQPPVKWPLAEAGKADLFEPIPFGADQRGNVVTILLMFASVLIGAMPRMGKTFALRIIALACALDPNARVRIWELKGTGDLAALKHVAHEYGSGADRETLELCLASVRNYAAQLDTRAKTLREVAERSPELVPENKVTPELCADRRLGLFPDVLIIDEVQEAFSDPELGSQFASLLVPVTKRGPALAMMLVLATQRPDKDSLPTAISANIGIRYCLKVMSYIASNMVLGDGMSTQGYNAADFARSDKGIGWLTGEADDPQIVRGCYIDAPKAEAIALRARAARRAAGTLSGFALDETEPDADRDFLADVLAVFGVDANLWCDTIASRLMEQIPEGYDALTKESVGAMLRTAGVNVRQVRERGKPVRAGCARADVVAVAAETSES